MNYYLYISETKVGMLHSQIGVTRFCKIKAALKLKIPFFEASLDSDTGEKSIYARAAEAPCHSDQERGALALLVGLGVVQVQQDFAVVQFDLLDFKSILPHTGRPPVRGTLNSPESQN
ncbi:hypothetical protein EI171_23470 [Bradyrhizobium sp. LCT2]|uniref:DUF7019 family protein n=1 Tax=Bradyrhizobium sp. LCT2 TaxID=2493093 RepID=UPI001374245F|nr:hypothetical protein [Bradyrhizobium sp. LCT2]QHP69993.1 hypothetical protein EI171_23470 [Bradyrhizobium sp. LCT2]